MSKIVTKPEYLSRLEALDNKITVLTNEKIKLLFEMLTIRVTASEEKAMLEWEMILITVPDKGMAIQLNRLSVHIPNLKFVIDAMEPLFTLRQGNRARKVLRI